MRDQTRIRILLALLAAFVAQALFNGQFLGIRLPVIWNMDLRFGAACVLLVVAMALFGRSATHVGTETEPPDSAGVAGLRLPSRVALRIGTGGTGLAIVFYVISLALYLIRGEDALVQGLWLASLALLVISQVAQSNSLDPGQQDGHTIWWEWGLVATIVLAAFGLRYWHLTEIPSNLHGDISSYGLQALEILHSPQAQWFRTGWSDAPMFDFVVMSWSMRLFGENLFGLSMSSVIQGTLTVLALYLLGKELFGWRVGAIAASLLAISYTHIQFSRIVTTASPLLSIILLFYFLFRGFRTGRRPWFVLAGLSLGIGLLGYYASRVGAVVVSLLLLWMFLWQRKAVFANVRNWLAFGVGALLGFGPMMGFVFSSFDAFVGRGSIVTLLNPQVTAHLMEKYRVATMGEVLLEQVKRTFLTFHFYPDASTHFGFPGPMVDALTAALLVLGAGYSLTRLRKAEHFTLITWVLITLVLGGVVTNDPPFWPHLVIVLPAVAILAALAAERAWAGLAQPFGQRGEVVIGLLLAAAIAVVGVRNWQAYYDQVRDNAEPRVRIARYLQSLPAGYQVRVVTDPFSWRERELQFLARGVAGADITADQLRSALPLPLNVPAVFILTPNHKDLLPFLQSTYPSGQVTEHADQSESVAFLSYTAGPAPTMQPSQRPIGLLSGDNLGLVGLVLAGATLVLLLTLRHKPVQEILRVCKEIMAAKWGQHKVSQSQTVVSIQAEAQSTLVESEISAERQRSHGRLVAGVAGTVLALVLAYLAQGIYDGNSNVQVASLFKDRMALDWSENGRLWFGSGLYLLALVLFGIVVPHSETRGNPKQIEPNGFPLLLGHLRGKLTLLITTRWASLVVLGVGLLLYVLSMLRFVGQGEDVQVQWLWAGGMILFVASQWTWPWRRRSHDPRTEFSPRFKWSNIAVVAAILAAAFWLRFNQLETIPSDFHGDMSSYGLQARQLLLGVENRLFHEGWASIPLLGYLPSAVFMRLFGDNLFGLNMTAVAEGMISLLGLYLLVWRVFDRHRPAVLATGALAINVAHIHFSRIAAYMDPWPFGIFALFLVVDGLKARRPLSFAVAGVLLGLDIQMYYSGRVIFFILAAFLVYVLIFRRHWLFQNVGGLVLLLLGFLVAFGPGLIYFVRNWDLFMERSREVLIFNPPVMVHSYSKYLTDSVTGVVLEQVKRSLLMFNYSIDSSTQFGYPHPLFSSLVSPLVVLGFGYSVRRWRTLGTALALIWLVLVMVVGSILTDNAPFWPRLVGMMVIGAVLAGLALDRIWAALEQVGQTFQATGKLESQRHLASKLACAPLLGTAVVAFLIFAGWQDWDLYSRTVQNNARPQARIGRFLYSLPPEIAACGFTKPYELRVRETYFLAWPRVVVDLPSDGPDALVERCPGPPFVWILYPNHLNRLAALRARWPDGVVQEHRDLNAVHVFTSYLVMDGQATAGALSLPPTQVPAATAEPQKGIPSFAAYNSDGSPFMPQRTFLGDTSSAVWEIAVGQVQVTGESFVLQVGPVPGHDAVYDYVRLVAASGQEYRFEAEDVAITRGDAFAAREGADGHWWLQNYARFSNGQGLVVQKQEMVPVLVTTMPVPDGIYSLFVGSFKGDKSNGIFALGLRW